jgi:hypothetical protein
MRKWLRTWLGEIRQQWRCLVLGHDGFQEIGGPGLVWLRCSRCGGRTAGWHLTTGHPDRPHRPPVLKFEGDPARFTRPLGGVTHPVTVVPYQYCGTMDDQTADLVAALNMAGDHAGVQLLLMPAKSDIRPK